MIIGFTGTQEGLVLFQCLEIKKLLIQFECSEFVHGDCIGADEEAANIAIDAGVKLFTVYPQNQIIRKRAFWQNPDRNRLLENGTYQLLPSGIRVKWMPGMPPLERNKVIVDLSTTMLAAPKQFNHTIRSGTWATIRYAWQREKKNPLFKVVIVPPVIREENDGRED